MQSFTASSLGVSATAAFFVSRRDYVTLSNPTRMKSEEETSPPVETETWADEARVLALISAGFSYSDAFHMSYRDARRYSSLHRALSIPDSERIGGTRVATEADYSLVI